MIETQEAFEAFAKRIAEATGVDKDTSLRWAAAIGDTPEMDRRNPGTILVRDDKNRVIGRVPASVLG